MWSSILPNIDGAAPGEVAFSNLSARPPPDPGDVHGRGSRAPGEVALSNLSARPDPGDVKFLFFYVLQQHDGSSSSSTYCSSADPEEVVLWNLSARRRAQVM